MKKFFRLMPLVALVIVILASGALAAEDRLTKEEMGKVESYLVPSPGELFVAINNMGEFDWGAVVTSNPNSNYNNTYLRALNLGTRSADGFIAIQAKDNKKLGTTISTILALARSLAVDEMILAKGSELHSLATNKKWTEVHRELDKLRDQVENYIKQLGDDQNAVLVSAGGWLEGLRAVTKLLSQQYNPSASSILHQPAMVTYFQQRFKTMSPEYKANPVVAMIEAKLPEIARLIQGEPGKPISKENVEKLHGIAADLILAIERG